MEPPVSDPSDRGTSPAATAAADPPLEPPGIRSSAHGLRTGPAVDAVFSFDDPIANSSQLVLPTTIAPARSRRATAVASYGGTYSASMRDEAVVRTPQVHRLSLSAIGTPASGASFQRARSWSIEWARASARSPTTALNAWIPESSAAIRSSASWQHSRAERRPVRTASRMSDALAIIRALAAP